MPPAPTIAAQKYLRKQCGLPAMRPPPKAQVTTQPDRISTQTSDPGECCEHSRGVADLVESTWDSVTPSFR